MSDLTNDEHNAMAIDQACSELRTRLTAATALGANLIDVRIVVTAVASPDALLDVHMTGGVGDG